MRTRRSGANQGVPVRLPHVAADCLQTDLGAGFVRLGKDLGEEAAQVVAAMACRRFSESRLSRSASFFQ